ncbi:MAG TPA: SDR family oxidoreductase [Steroidobacteraceae bacterium]|nr:SDR family oxidoreductase [Steroidobacteraceae bacterium]
MKLSDAKHAFITGGASGIGLGIADAFSQRGIAVTIADIDRPALAAVMASRTGRWGSQPLDTRDREAWGRSKQEAERAFGPVDILVNNAGIAPDGRELADAKPDSFDRIIAINLVGVFNGIRTFAADMRGRGRGHIVNTSSMAGLVSGSSGVGAYAAAKFGVVGMSETLRSELAPHGVGVSVLCPGLVTTNLPKTTLKVGGELRDGAGEMPPSDVTTADVARVVMQGIEENLPYLISHPQHWPGVERRLLALRDAFSLR